VAAAEGLTGTVQNEKNNNLSPFERIIEHGEATKSNMKYHSCTPTEVKKALCNISNLAKHYAASLT
jgi:hypothetical protein